ncbi:hypothetical protein HJC23_006595 [Cyclotella cryptica]|uniref:Orc1-like AAA ATPase domain-containing protein n=1 Tax=Cyclotella cryptica TaxID=29204 RepID=A0ABD3QX40_9STRA|eukprot:CCRYP_000994-RB/>CCRYP_000994-RB protein AED:0.02 eAED:0.02 QI:557/1/1/1/0.75/0.6/5/1920/1331
MSKVCWIDLATWIALAAHHERKWIQEINKGCDHNERLPTSVADLNADHGNLELNVVKLTYVQRCVKVSLLLLNRLTRDGTCEDADVETCYTDGNSVKPEDISLRNMVVEILCPVDHGNADQDYVDIEICREGCTVCGVQLEMNQMQSILDSSNSVEFVQPMKNMLLTKRSFVKSRHQYLRQIGLLLYRLFSRGGASRDSILTRDDQNAFFTNDAYVVSITKNEDNISSASKLMRMMSLDEFQKPLLDARVPVSVCRLVMDLIHSGKYDEETSFQTFTDVLNELQDIISGRPHVLFYSPETPTLGSTCEGRIDFGNIVYGREVETNRILELAALQHELLKNRLILISGNGGEGKTFMIEGIRNHLVTACGWVHVGVKFDRSMHNSPLSAISSAFETFIATLLSKSGQEPYVNAITMSLQLFLSPCMTVLLCDLIPSLRRLFPALMQRVISDDNLSSLTEEHFVEHNHFDEILSDPESSRNRLHYSIRRLVHAISSLGRPLLLVFDDLQWAGRASLDLLTSLMIEWDAVHFEENAPIARVLFVGLYRSDEVDQDHILSTRYFPIFNSTGTVEVHSIQLQAITKEACNSMISCALRLPVRLTRSLADIVHAKALGNVFYVKMFIESLAINKTLWYSLSDKRWMWNLESVRATPIAKNVAQLMKRNLQTLPETTLSALKLLSCFGSQADEPTLSLLTDHVNIINALVVAIDRNIVEKQGEVYKFAHDILEQSAYDMMSPQEQSTSHLLIGSELLDNALESHCSHVRPLTFVAIDQINRAKMLGNSQLLYSVRYATLNLKAAESSMSVSDFAAALSYAQHGISFLSGHLWRGSTYKLTLRLYETASNACFTSSQGEKMRGFLDEIFEHAQSLRDKLHSYLLLIETLGALGKDCQAIDSAFALLAELGETLPRDVSPSSIYNEVSLTKNALSRFSDDDIKNAPRVTDWNISARMRVIASVIPCLFNLQPQYIPLLACRIVNLSIQHGFCSDSAFGLFAYANPLVNSDINEAYRWGKLSISLHETFETKDKHPRLKCQVYGFLAFFCEPLQAVVDVIRRNYADCLLAGDAYYGCISIIFFTRFSMMCGHNLSDLEKACKIFATQMTSLNQPELCLTYVGICEVITSLSGSPTAPFSLMPGLNIATDEEHMERLLSEGKSAPLQVGYFNYLFIDFWFTRYDEAALWAEKYRSRGQRRFLDVYHSFYEGLTAFQLARKSADETHWIDMGKCAIVSFQKWVDHSKWNFENKLLLLKAELKFLEGLKDDAIEIYQASIKSAKDHRFVHEEGLAFEMLGSLHTHYGDEKQAKLQLSSARKCYEKWGALAIIALRTPAEDGRSR